MKHSTNPRSVVTPCPIVLPTRRDALAVLAGGALSALAAPTFAAEPANYRLATFSVAITPPVGHPLLGGSFKPSTGVDDPLHAIGFTLLGPAKPIVIVALDWCELRNDTYQHWRETLAAAAGTTIDRVFVSSVHQHDAPYVDTGAQRLLDGVQAGVMCDPEYCEATLTHVVAALTSSLPHAEVVTHLGLGQARIEGIASNRRIVDADGRVSFRRYSSARDAAIRALPEGTIDPWLKTISFWRDEQPVAALSSYATHPMSNYGGGRVSTDFVGLARERRQRDDPRVKQLYLTSCSGDVTAGKFNDGSPTVRGELADRLYAGMKTAWEQTRRVPLKQVECRSKQVVLPFWDTPALSESALRAKLADAKLPFLQRAMAALGLSSLERNRAGHAIDIQAIDFGSAQFLLLPAEAFVEYQLAAQQMCPDSFVMVAGFGECAPGYLPTISAVKEGFREEHGYCWVGEAADPILREAMREVLSPKQP
ncbi:MAG: hypothetical protein JSS27_17540 [Planctomycetes bacterium]|nr:hypothetical protein [Planctomycetota bacterium]